MTGVSLVHPIDKHIPEDLYSEGARCVYKTLNLHIFKLVLSVIVLQAAVFSVSNAMQYISQLYGCIHDEKNSCVS